MVDAIPNDPYGQDYQDQLFQKLSPQVEQMVARLFPHSRGAKFGAQGSILAKRLANLRLEIALDSAKRGAAQTEQLRREAVSKQLETERYNRDLGEKQRVEGENRNNQFRQQQWYENLMKQNQESQSKAIANSRKQEAADYFYQHSKDPATGKYDPERAQADYSAWEKQNYPPAPVEPGLIDSAKKWFSNKSSPESIIPSASPATADFGTRGQVGFDSQIGNPQPFEPTHPASYRSAYQFGPDTLPADSKVQSSVPDNTGNNFGYGTASRGFGGDTTNPSGGFAVAGPGNPAKVDPVLGEFRSVEGGKYGRDPYLFVPNGVSDSIKSDRTSDALTRPGGVKYNPYDSVSQSQLYNRSLPSGYKTGKIVPTTASSLRSLGYDPANAGYVPVATNYGGGGFNASDNSGSLDNLKKETDQYRIANPTPGESPDFNPYTPGKYTDYASRDRFSGSVNAGTLNEFNKTRRGFYDTGRDIFNGFRGIF